MRKRRETFEVRPVSGRTLQSARDTLRPHLSDARCLDLFSGQGRFGEAALEEGAQSVDFVEQNRKTLEESQKRITKRFPQSAFHCVDALKFLETPRAPYTVVFVDPPFPLWTSEFSSRLFTSLSAHLAQEAILLVKYPTRMIAFSTIRGFQLWKETDCGESKLLYLSYE